MEDISDLKCQRIISEPYLCMNCEFATQFLTDYTEHINKCKVKEESQKNQFQNLFNCQKSILEEYACQECNFTSYFLKHLKEHIQEHRLENQWLKCDHSDECTYKTKIPQNLKRRKVFVHSSDEFSEWLHCGQCEFKTKHFFYLRHHLRGKHKIKLKKSHDLQYYKKSFNISEITTEPVEYDLAIHIVGEKTVKWFYCKHCDYKTRKQIDLAYHYNKHTSDFIKWLQCDQCDYKTIRPQYLRQHVKNIHSPPESIKWLQCDHCDHKTKNLHTLENHVLSKHRTLDDVALSCDQCKFKTKLAYSLKRHKLLIHTPDDLLHWLYCDQCEYKTKHSFYLQRHLNVKHKMKLKRFKDETYYREQRCFKSYVKRIKAEAKDSSVTWFGCHQCEYRTRKQINLDFHMNNKHIPEGYIKWHCCDQCDYRTLRLAHLKQHCKNLHTPVECIQWLQCDQCDYKCKGRHTLDRHVLSRHTPLDVAAMSCDQCKFKTKLSDSLKRHKEFVHSADSLQWLQCDQCEYQTKHLFYLRRHFREKHKIKIKMYRSAKYSKAFKANLLQKYKKVEDIKSEIENLASNSFWYQCETCEYRAKTRAHLDAHVTNKHAALESIKWFECAQCDYRTKRTGTLKQHIKNKHTPLEDIKWFQCELCDYKAKFLGTLDRHMLSKHTSLDQVGLSCDQCKFKTKLPESLKRHKNLVHAEEGLEWQHCQTCRYKTKHLFYLRRHLREKHRIIVSSKELEAYKSKTENENFEVCLKVEN